MKTAINITLGCLLGIAAALFLGALQAHATWKPEYADASPDVQAWYLNAQVMPAAQDRLGFKSCCAHSDVVKTQFRVNKKTAGDEWFFLNDNSWQRIPDDIIHWGETSPDGQPTLFAIGNGALPTCFFPGEGGN